MYRIVVWISECLANSLASVSCHVLMHHPKSVPAFDSPQPPPKIVEFVVLVDLGSNFIIQQIFELLVQVNLIEQTRDGLVENLIVGKCQLDPFVHQMNPPKSFFAMQPSFKLRPTFSEQTPLLHPVHGISRHGSVVVDLKPVTLFCG